MSEFNLEKFRNEFLKSDGWQVSDCYKPYDDKFLRRDAQDAYEGAKWAQDERQKEIDALKTMLKIEQCFNQAHKIMYEAKAMNEYLVSSGFIHGSELINQEKTDFNNISLLIDENGTITEVKNNETSK